ncbi:MAG: acyl-CoA thioesterase [Elusimicrobiota bacterium]
MSAKLKPKPVRASKTVLADLIMPEDANPRGKAFGGSILKLIDKAAYVCACRHAGAAGLVTVSMDAVSFKVPIDVGELVILEAQVHFVGRTSLEIGVEVYAENLATGERRAANSCRVSLVAVDQKGRPAPVPALRPETPNEKKRYLEAEKRRQRRVKS